MKKHLTLLLLLCSIVGPRLVLASGPTSVPALLQAAPTAERPGTPSVRPLTRYLTAVLHLTPEQAAAVQQALRNCPTRTLAPEDLTLSLSPVLTPEAQERLQSLQNNVTTYRALYYLAARH